MFWVWCLNNSIITFQVTGGNKGIGYAIVERLAKELKNDWHVFLTGNFWIENFCRLILKQSRVVHPYKLQLISESSLKFFISLQFLTEAIPISDLSLSAVQLNKHISLDQDT